MKIFNADFSAFRPTKGRRPAKDRTAAFTPAPKRLKAAFGTTIFIYCFFLLNAIAAAAKTPASARAPAPRVEPQPAAVPPPADEASEAPVSEDESGKAESDEPEEPEESEESDESDESDESEGLDPSGVHIA